MEWISGRDYTLTSSRITYEEATARMSPHVTSELGYWFLMMRTSTCLSAPLNNAEMQLLLFAGGYAKTLPQNVYILVLNKWNPLLQGDSARGLVEP